jgi:hypothetical protein
VCFSRRNVTRYGGIFFAPSLQALRAVTFARTIEKIRKFLPVSLDN